MFDIINIFDLFMPQLLLYPNPADPLNPEAANLYNKNFEKFKEKAREHVKKYAISDNQDQIKSSVSAQNGQDHHQANGAHVNGGTNSKNVTVDKHSDKESELSETSDLDGLDDDEDGDGAMNLGSDDEEEKKSQ